MVNQEESIKTSSPAEVSPKKTKTIIFVGIAVVIILLAAFFLFKGVLFKKAPTEEISGETAKLSLNLTSCTNNMSYIKNHCTVIMQDDISKCGDIENPSFKETCSRWYSLKKLIETGDISFCDKFSSEFIEVCKDSVADGISISDCQNIGNKTTEVICSALISQDVSYCNQINIQDESGLINKYNCMAWVNNDHSLCETGLAFWCMDNMLKKSNSTLSVLDCEKIENSEEKGECYGEVFEIFAYTG